MAFVESRNGKYRVVFRYGGRRYSKSLKTNSARAANSSLARLDDNLRRLELGTNSNEPQSTELYEQIGRLKVQLEWLKKKVATDSE